MLKIEKHCPDAVKPYRHLARAHGAGSAYSTIFGKNRVFGQNITSFGAVPHMLRRHFVEGDNVSL